MNLRGRDAVPAWHLLLIFALPAILTLDNPNWVFQNIGNMDAWYSFGSFQHFPRFENLRPSYSSERLAWIVPGYLLTRFLGAVSGVAALHCLVYWTSLFSFHYIVSKLADYRTALVGTLLLGCYPCFIGANGWDYIDSMSIALLFLSLAFVCRASSQSGGNGLWVFLSGAAWFLMIYNFLAWAAFTPFYFYLAAGWPKQGEQAWRTVRRVAAWLVGTGLVTTAVLEAIWLAMGARGFFYRQTLLAAWNQAQISTNPWLPRDWYREATWLVIPFFATVAGAFWITASRLERRQLPENHRRLLWFYLLSFATMVALTINQNRLLGFDYDASILIPGAFLTLSITFFRPPKSAGAALFYGVTMTACGLCLYPLHGLERYRWLFHWQVAVALAFIALPAGLSMLRKATLVSWVTIILAFASLSSVLLPLHPAAAWHIEYRGSAISERVARTITTVTLHLPGDRYPIFWIADSDDLMGAEYRAIMCAFLAHNNSMTHFPQVDDGKSFLAGDRIVVAAAGRELAASAVGLLARHGVTAALRSEDKIEYGDTSYWVSQLEVLQKATTHEPGSVH